MKPFNLDTYNTLNKQLKASFRHILNGDMSVTKISKEQYLQQILWTHDMVINQQNTVPSFQICNYL